MRTSELVFPRTSSTIHGALSVPDIPGLAREFLREYRLDYVPDGVNQTFGKSADVNGNLKVRPVALRVIQYLGTQSAHYRRTQQERTR